MDFICKLRHVSNVKKYKFQVLIQIYILKSANFIAHNKNAQYMTIVSETMKLYIHKDFALNLLLEVEEGKVMINWGLSVVLCFVHTLN